MDGAAREDFVPGDFRVPRDWNTDQYLDRRLGTACFTNRHTYLIDISSFCWVFLLSASCFLRRQKICWLLDWTCKWACTYSRARNGFGMMLKLKLWGGILGMPGNSWALTSWRCTFRYQSGSKAYGVSVIAAATAAPQPLEEFDMLRVWDTSHYPTL